MTIDEIVRQCRAAVAWTYRNAESFGGDRDRIYVTGNSAGGHLAAMLALTDWEAIYGLPANVIKGACPFSGLYDLTPLRFTWLQPKLQLDAEQILRSSPMSNIRSNAPPLLLVWGADETQEFWRQSEAFHEATSLPEIERPSIPWRPAITTPSFLLGTNLTGRSSCASSST